MKKILFALIAALSFVACSKKDVLKWLDRNNTPPPPALCVLDSIYPTVKVNYAEGRANAVGIHYNDKGNPVLLNYTYDHYGTYKFAVQYKYDAKNRLVEILPPLDGSVPDYLNDLPLHTKFVYQGNSKLPVRDTIFYKHPFPTNPQQLWNAEQLFYDAQGRINKVIRKSSYDNSILETAYKYDANGNKQITRDYDGTTPAPFVYSNKPSLYSLHPVWSLISKDYSKNLRQSAVKTFTSKGLPETITNNTLSGYYSYELFEAGQPFRSFLGIESSVELKFTYTCAK